MIGTLMISKIDHTQHTIAYHVRFQKAFDCYLEDIPSQLSGSRVPSQEEAKDRQSDPPKETTPANLIYMDLL